MKINYKNLGYWMIAIFFAYVAYITFDYLPDVVLNIIIMGGMGALIMYLFIKTVFLEYQRKEK